MGSGRVCEGPALTASSPQMSVLLHCVDTPCARVFYALLKYVQASFFSPHILGVSLPARAPLGTTG